MPGISLEEKLAIELIDHRIDCKPVDVERALLVASGVKTKKALATYREKLDRLQMRGREFSTRRPGARESLFPEAEKARNLFASLWQDKPLRYNHNYKLTDVIDAQMEPGSGLVGNCVGLTALFSVLALREGLPTQLLYTPRHVSNVMTLDGIDYHVENTHVKGFGVAKNSFVNGFGVSVSLKDSKTEPVLSLASDIYHSKSHSPRTPLRRTKDTLMMRFVAKPDIKGLRMLEFTELGDTGYYHAALHYYNKAMNGRDEGSFRVQTILVVADAHVGNFASSVERYRGLCDNPDTRLRLDYVFDPCDDAANVAMRMHRPEIAKAYHEIRAKTAPPPMD